MSPSYELSIFDFDGTLADSLPCFIGAMNDAAVRYGFRGIDQQDADVLRGCGPWELMERLDIAMWQVPMITAFMRKRMADRIDTVALFPGVHEALEDLAARGHVISIVSSNGEASIRHVLGARLASLVQDYRCDVSIFGKRPRFRQVLAATGVPAARALAVGDELRDLKAARAEGIPFAGVTWGFATPEALRAAEPDMMFERVEDLAGARAVGASRLLPA